MDELTSFLMYDNVIDGLEDISDTIFSASFSDPAISSTRPRAIASCALNFLPDIAIYIALPEPTILGKITFPPAPAFIPMEISGWPIIALSSAILISVDSAISSPPPSEYPFNIDITGFSMLLINLDNEFIDFLNSSAELESKDASISISAPAEKLLPYPVNTITFTLSILFAIFI